MLATDAMCSEQIRCSEPNGGYMREDWNDTNTGPVRLDWRDVVWIAASAFLGILATWAIVYWP